MPQNTYQKVDRSIDRNDLDYLLRLVFETKKSKSIDDSKNDRKLDEKKSDLKSNGQNLKSKNKSNSKEVIYNLDKKSSDLSIEQINLSSNYFVQHLINLVNNSIALKQSNPPYDCHPDLLKRYLKDAHKIQNFNDVCDLTQPVLKFIVIDADLTVNKDEKYDPYFKVFSPNDKSANKYVYKSKHFNNESKPIWNEFFYVILTRFVLDLF